MARAHEYRTHLTWTGAAAGPTASYATYSREYVVGIDGKPPLRGSADPLFRGDGTLHNPEDLLVAALSGCHLLSYLALAARAGVHVVAYEDGARGTMVLEGGGGRFTEVVLRPRVTIAAGGDEALAMRLHDQAHAECFIAASMNFPVRHEPEVQVAGAAADALRATATA
jgi:organic hydroperoxide reductase OsmC/OhrA